MDNRSEIREFLTSRRAKISPQQAGLPSRRRTQHARKDPSSCVAYPENVCRGKRNGTVFVM
ncbi:hypothetical protein GCM10010404_23350 [Nonomuraea africana]